MFKWIKELLFPPKNKLPANYYINAKEERDSTKLAAGFIDRERGLLLYHPIKNTGGVLLENLINENKHLNKEVIVLNNLEGFLTQSHLNLVRELVEKNKISELRMKNIDTGHEDWKHLFQLLQRNAPLARVSLNFCDVPLEYRSMFLIGRIMSSFELLETFCLDRLPSLEPSSAEKKNLFTRLNPKTYDRQNKGIHGQILLKSIGTSTLHNLRQIQLASLPDDESTTLKFFLQLRSAKFLNHVEQLECSYLTGNYFSLVGLTMLLREMTNLEVLWLPFIQMQTKEIVNYTLQEIILCTDSLKSGTKIAFVSEWQMCPPSFQSRMDLVEREYPKLSRKQDPKHQILTII
eukprot:snap_masked-scaffold_42-processed-gene-1.31-mRNA-1 protein AED:0.87 eAED:1.00 QI:0/-1/0/1/-1/1/1/0/347